MREELAIAGDATAHAPENCEDQYIAELLVEERRLIGDAEPRHARSRVHIDNAPAAISRTANGIASNQAAETPDRLSENNTRGGCVEQSPHGKPFAPRKQPGC